MGTPGILLLFPNLSVSPFSERRGRRGSVHHKGESPPHGRLPVYRLQRRAALNQQEGSAQSSV